MFNVIKLSRERAMIGNKHGRRIAQWMKRLLPETAAKRIQRESDEALARVQAAGYTVHFYMPAAGIENSTLANDLRRLGNSGHIITDRNGKLVGKVATHLSRDQEAQARRATFRLVTETEGPD